MGSQQLHFHCEYVLPDRSQDLGDVVSRWSHTNVDIPALVVVPKTDDDIVDAINYSKANNLTLVTANGGRAPFHNRCFVSAFSVQSDTDSQVPINSKTLYLDMKNFREVTVDKTSGTVRIQGGASTGDVVEATTAEGYYTLWPNSNSVGYVGCVMGGGSDALNGLHGFLVDAVESFQLITAEGHSLEVSADSEGNERTLFNALCGAGFGLAVVTSVVMKAFRLGSLGLSNDCIWTRRLVFPASAIEVAARTFANLQQIPPGLMLTMVCVRSPPNAPSPGSPLIMLTGSYYGPIHEAEEAGAALFTEGVVNATISADTLFVPFADVNVPLKPLSANGGHKAFSTAFLTTIDAGTLQETFDSWLKLGEECPDARPTTLVFNKWDTTAIQAHGQTPTGRAKFFEHRHQSVFASAMRWCTKEESRKAAEQFGEDFLKIVRRNETGPPKSLANNQRPGMNMEELYSKERLAELRGIKKMWDPSGVFWSPSY